MGNNQTVDTDTLNRIGVKLFLGITDDWGLKDSERMILAGLASHTILDRWRQQLERGEKIPLSRDTLERLSHVASIRKGIERLTPRSQWAEHIKKPNCDFDNQSALERMLSGKITDLEAVRRYYDGLQGAHFS